MKKIMNDPKQIVDEMLAGMELACQDRLKLLKGPKVMLRRQAVPGKVALLSGGGTGHEPAHAGYVGVGMLDAAVCGNVFASPSAGQIYEGIRAANQGAGVLLIIKNYSGDIMNFEMAAELAELDGIETRSVVVADDVAIPRDAPTAGRRGIAGTIFVHKLAGALAERGASLAEVCAMAQSVIDHTRSMGMALSPCTLPEASKQRFSMGENEMEIGMGIHGETGVQRCQIATADEIAERLLEPILRDMPLTKGAEVAVLINGLGATPLMELYVVARKIHALLTEQGIQVYRMLVGNYMTALEMAGCSISLLELDERKKELLDAPADTPALVIP